MAVGGPRDPALSHNIYIYIYIYIGAGGVRGVAVGGPRDPALPGGPRPGPAPLAPRLRPPHTPPAVPRGTPTHTRMHTHTHIHTHTHTHTHTQMGSQTCGLGRRAPGDHCRHGGHGGHGYARGCTFRSEAAASVSRHLQIREEGGHGGHGGHGDARGVTVTRKRLVQARPLGPWRGPARRRAKFCRPPRVWPR